jgi:hypothetical protein
MSNMKHLVLVFILTTLSFGCDSKQNSSALNAPAKHPKQNQVKTTYQIYNGQSSQVQKQKEFIKKLESQMKGLTARYQFLKKRHDKLAEEVKDLKRINKLLQDNLESLKEQRPSGRAQIVFRCASDSGKFDELIKFRLTITPIYGTVFDQVIEKKDITPHEFCIELVSIIKNQGIEASYSGDDSQCVFIKGIKAISAKCLNACVNLKINISVRNVDTKNFFKDDKVLMREEIDND